MRASLVHIRVAEVRQLRAVVEHVATRSHTISAPPIAYTDGAERGAALEHVVHFRHVGRVEAAEIQAGEL